MNRYKRKWSKSRHRLVRAQKGRNRPKWITDSLTNSAWTMSQLLINCIMSIQCLYKCLHSVFNCSRGLKIFLYKLIILILRRTSLIWKIWFTNTLPFRPSLVRPRRTRSLGAKVVARPEDLWIDIDLPSVPNYWPYVEGYFKLESFLYTVIPTRQTNCSLKREYL